MARYERKCTILEGNARTVLFHISTPTFRMFLPGVGEVRAWSLSCRSFVCLCVSPVPGCENYRRREVCESLRRPRFLHNVTLLKDNTKGIQLQLGHVLKTPSAASSSSGNSSRTHYQLPHARFDKTDFVQLPATSTYIGCADWDCYGYLLCVQQDTVICAATIHVCSNVKPRPHLRRKYLTALIGAR